MATIKHRVLFFSYWYPNKVSPVFPVFIKKHAEAAALLNDVTVISMNIIRSRSLYKTSIDVSIDANGLETHRIYIESRFHKLFYIFLPLHYLILKNHLQRVTTQKRFDILHSNILFPCGIVGHRIAKKFGMKHIITEHWSRLNSFFAKNWYRSAGKMAYDRAHAVTCVSELLASTVRKYTENLKVSVVPNVVDEHEFFIERAVEKHPRLTFVAAANWTPPKNPFYFLDALEALTKQNKLPDFRMLLIGNGSQLETVKSKKYSFDIEYTGVLDASNLRKRLNESHIFVHGSEYETFSTIIAETLMCGLPGVVSPVGIAGEVINDRNGFITDNTQEDWIRKIEACVNKQYDPEAISNGLKGRYSPGKIGQQFNDVYVAL